MKRIKYCIANWKMYQNIENVDSFIKELNNYKNKINSKIIICPSNIHMGRVNKLNSNNNFDIGSQDCSHQDNGAYTGEISATMIKDFNCKYVILGHSERRTLFFESNEVVNKKVRKCIENDLIPIICVGESIDIKQKNETKNYIKNQILKALKGIDIKHKFIIAYEPIWAIGTGLSADSDYASEIHSEIRKILHKLGYNSNDISVVYGGSVNSKNSKEYLRYSNIDGFLIGTSSLNYDNFMDIFLTF